MPKQLWNLYQQLSYVKLKMFVLHPTKQVTLRVLREFVKPSVRKPATNSATVHVQVAIRTTQFDKLAAHLLDFQPP